MPALIPKMQDLSCPVCGCSLKQFQIDIDCHITMCENVKCDYPLNQPEVESFVNMAEGALTSLLHDQKVNVNVPLPQTTPPSSLSDIEHLLNEPINEADSDTTVLTPMDTSVAISLFDGLDDMLHDTKSDFNPFQQNVELDQLLGL